MAYHNIDLKKLVINRMRKQAMSKTFDKAMSIKAHQWRAATLVFELRLLRFFVGATPDQGSSRGSPGQGIP
jgi:hypothetical protein